MPKALKEFARERQAVDSKTRCVVCKLPATALVQIRETSRTKVNFDLVSAWLKSEYKLTVTRADLQAHARARHDAENT